MEDEYKNEDQISDETIKRKHNLSENETDVRNKVK